MKKSLKKGGVAEIVSLMIIVGIVLALIIAVVLPMVRNARGTGKQNAQDQIATQSAINNLRTDVGSEITTY